MDDVGLFEIPSAGAAPADGPFTPVRPDSPLAVRMRPRAVDELVGQDHLLAPGAPLRQLVSGAAPLSVILWGPPGSGKTTIAHLVAGATDRRFVAMSALSAGVKDVRAVIDAARSARRSGGAPTCQRSSPPSGRVTCHSITAFTSRAFSGRNWSGQRLKISSRIGSRFVAMPSASCSSLAWAIRLANWSGGIIEASFNSRPPPRRSGAPTARPGRGCRVPSRRSSSVSGRGAPEARRGGSPPNRRRHSALRAMTPACSKTRISLSTGRVSAAADGG